MIQLAEVRPQDLALDVGAGLGQITIPLAQRARRVIAVESDAAIAHALERRTKSLPNVRVVHADMLDVPLPRRPFVVVANLPFGGSLAFLHRLLNARYGSLERAAVVVQNELALACTSVNRMPRDRRVWTRRYELIRGPKIRATAFDPEPSVDARVLILRRRS